MAATARSIFVSGRVIVGIASPPPSGLIITYTPLSAPNGTTVTLTITGASPNVAVSQIQTYSPGSVVSASEYLGNTDGSGNFTYVGLASWGPGYTSASTEVYINGVSEGTFVFTNPSPLPENDYWISTINGDISKTFGITTDFIDNIYTAGQTYAVGAGSDRDAYITKYNSSGTIQWQQTLGDIYEFDGHGIAHDSMSNVYVVGTANISSQLQVLIIKYNSNGVLQWNRTLYTGDGSNNHGYDIVIDSSDNLYIGGDTTNESSPYDTRALFAKYNSSGALQWQHTLTDMSISRITIDLSNNIYVCGGGPDFVGTVIKLDNSGTSQWQRTLQGPALSYTQMFDLAVDTSGNVYSVGYSTNVSVISTAIISKFNSSGTLQWQQMLENQYGCDFRAIVQDSSGNLYAAGITLETELADDIGFIIAKYNSSGTLQWQRKLSNSSVMDLQEMTIDSFGDLCVTGCSSVNPEDPTEALVFKFPADGSLTGTHGTYVYSVSTFTSSAASLTVDTPTYAVGTPSLVSSTPVLTSATPTFTNTITNV